MSYVEPKLIPLYSHDFLKGFALVSPEDFEDLKGRVWVMNRAGYAVSTKGEYMHRVIANAPKGEVVDHSNGNRVDNRRENLRVCSQQMNMCNVRRPKTKYRGVQTDKRDRGLTYRAAITSKGVTINLGTFASEIEAARGYDSASRQLHGEYGVLNFPDEMHYTDIDWIEHAKTIKSGSPANRKLSGEDVAEIQRRFANGESVKQLAREYGVSEPLIYLTKSGALDNRKHLSPEWVELALKRVLAGEAVARVSIDMRVSRYILEREVKALGDQKPPVVYKRRADSKVTPEQVAEIVSRVAAGEMQSALAKEYGVSLQTVNGYVRGRRRF